MGMDGRNRCARNLLVFGNKHLIKDRVRYANAGTGLYAELSRTQRAGKIHTTEAAGVNTSHTVVMSANHCTSYTEAIHRRPALPYGHAPPQLLRTTTAFRSLALARGQGYASLGARTSSATRAH
jgi:hypothetical protein